MESEPLTLQDIRDIVLKAKAQTRPPAPDCVVMDSVWLGRIQESFSPEIHPAYGAYQLGDRVFGLTIYLDETYPEPIFRCAGEYLAERAARDGQPGPT